MYLTVAADDFTRKIVLECITIGRFLITSIYLLQIASISCIRNNINRFANINVRL